MQPGLVAIAQVLALLGTVAGGLALIGATIVLVLLHRQRLARWTALGATALGATYGAVLLCASAVSRTSALAPGAPKVFCEIDCHVAFRIDTATRDGDRVRITLREEFRRNSIGAQRGDAPLTPGTRRVVLIDADGQRYRATSVTTLSAAPLYAPIRPGEAHVARLHFDVPRDVALRSSKPTIPSARCSSPTSAVCFTPRCCSASTRSSRAADHHVSSSLPVARVARTLAIRSSGVNGLPMKLWRASSGSDSPAW